MGTKRTGSKGTKQYEYDLGQEYSAVRMGNGEWMIFFEGKETNNYFPTLRHCREWYRNIIK